MNILQNVKCVLCPVSDGGLQDLKWVMDRCSRNLEHSFSIPCTRKFFIRVAGCLPINRTLLTRLEVYL